MLSCWSKAILLSSSDSAKICFMEFIFGDTKVMHLETRTVGGGAKSKDTYDTKWRSDERV